MIRIKKYIRYNLIVLYESIIQIVFLLPRFTFFNSIKSLIIKLLGGEVGKNTIFYSGVRIMPLNGIKLGDNVDLAKGVIITTKGGVKIGDRTLIGYNTQILSANHKIPSNREKIFYSGHICKEVIIKHDVWIGANCIILPGVTIEEGSVVAAGSVVTKNIDKYTIVAGSPAKVLRNRD